jgi:hypothetical protein
VIRERSGGKVETMKRFKEIFGDVVNLLLFLAGILLIVVLLVLLDPSIKRWVAGLFFKH